MKLAVFSANFLAKVHLFFLPKSYLKRKSLSNGKHSNKTL